MELSEHQISKDPSPLKVKAVTIEIKVSVVIDLATAKPAMKTVHAAFLG